jgi:DNA-binding NarL/FixJ family response regulator
MRRLGVVDGDSGVRHEAICEDHRAGPAEAAAARIDIASWIQSLTRRERRIARALGNGESTQEVAHRFHLSPARVSQLRREFERS